MTITDTPDVDELERAAAEHETAAADKSPHCKNPTHLQVTVTNHRETASVVAAYVPAMRCKNTHGVTPWGAVLAKNAARPLDGMHLLPDAVEWLPGQLRAHADVAAPGLQAVMISHTVGGVFVEFATLTPANAVNVADELDRIGAHAQSNMVAG